MNLQGKQTMKVTLADRDVGDDYPPYVIAEIGASHQGDLKKALRLIVAAKQAGADCVKFQAYEPDTITMNSDHPDFLIKDGPWKGRKLYELYEEAYTPFKWFPDLFAMAKELGITAFASVFDRSSVDMLEKLNCPFYKIASFEFCDIPLIQYVASTGKPLILSTGMASHAEIKQVDGSIDPWYARVYLHCVSGYPIELKDANLMRIKYLRSNYLVPIGLSDHTLGWIAPVAGVTLGACVVEKHLTLDRQEGGPDVAFSLEPVEFRYMVDAIQATHEALKPSVAASEQVHLPYRRSLYAAADIAAGERLSSENVCSIRPGGGLAPQLYPYVLGVAACRSVRRGHPLSLDDLHMDETLHEACSLVRSQSSGA